MKRLIGISIVPDDRRLREDFSIGFLAEARILLPVRAGSRNLYPVK
ncbi:MAG: hypothetical protein ACE5GV_10980 [Candidatus Scalindua sp.]